jgi:anti-sigma factor RsiW
MCERTFDERANAYLDNELSAAETAAFEAEMRDDPALAALVGAVRTAEAGLRELYADPGPIPDPLAAPVAGPHPIGRARPSWLPLGVAAALLLGAVALWPVLRPGPAYTPPSGRVIYQTITAAFEPSVVCDTPEKFLAYTKEALDEPLAADFAGASNLGVQLVGWRALGAAYDDQAARDRPRVLLARAPDGTEVVVYFRERGHAEPPVDVYDPIGVHAERFGRVTAYEISPLDEPVVLGLLSLD